MKHPNQEQHTTEINTKEMIMNPTQDKHIYTLDDYGRDVQKITDYINRDFKYKSTHIVAIYRGGLPLGVALSNKTESPLSILNYQRYDGGVQCTRDEVDIIHNASISSNETLIIVDDLVDEGVTMDKCVEYLRNKFPMNPIQVYTIFGKKDHKQTYESTYLREYPGKWIHFEPWE